MKACAVFSGAAACVSAVMSLIILLTGGSFKSSIFLPPVFNEINFVIDPLSAFFILIISFICFLGALYASGYIKPYLNKGMNISSHCVFYMLLEASMLLVPAVQNTLFFIFIWEIMSLSSFFLVMFESTPAAEDKNTSIVQKVKSAGIKYMIYMHLSVIFLIAAAAILKIKTGSYDFGVISEFLKTNPETADAVFLLVFAGFGIKAGFVPFHNWLPDAHPAAPSHVSGVMSGVMIKTGIYGILRMLYLSGAESKIAAYTVLIVSIISALWGVLYAAGRHDIKQLSAYHSIENIGIIGMGIGIGVLGIVYYNPYTAALGFAGALLHTLNHSIFKPLLFFAAGSIYKKTHTRDIEEMGGLIKKMPFTSLGFIAGSIAISGLPPFNGFISEFFIYAAMITGLGIKNPAVFSVMILSLASLALIGTMAVLCFTKASGVMLLGAPRSLHAEKADKDNEAVMIIPILILAALTLIIGLFPDNAALILYAPVSMFVKLPQAAGSIAAIAASISLLFFIFLIILAAVSLSRLIINRKQRQHNTWGCGYNRITPRMQYTASSYADLFISAVKPFFKRVEHVKKPKEIFPKEAYYESEIEDIEEAYIVKPLIELDEKFLQKFERIQNGNMQQYILFGLIFLIIALIGMIYYG